MQDGAATAAFGTPGAANRRNQFRDNLEFCNISCSAFKHVIRQTSLLGKPCHTERFSVRVSGHAEWCKVVRNEEAAAWELAVRANNCF